MAELSKKELFDAVFAYFLALCLSIAGVRLVMLFSMPLSIFWPVFLGPLVYGFLFVLSLYYLLGKYTKEKQ